MGSKAAKREASEPAAIDRRLVDAFQRDFPLCPRPFAEIAARLGLREDEVIARLRRLSDTGAVSRVGVTLTPHRAGWSTLAAIAVPEDRIDQVAALVSAYPEVNHNYQREHAVNLWFVITGPDRERVEAVLDDIEARTGLAVLDLPLEEAYRLDLGFPLQWN